MRSKQIPRWKNLLDRALEKDPKSNVYQLATLSEGGLSTTSQPKVRTVVHRGFLDTNARPASLPLLLTTTDIRLPKASQISQNSRVELAWWIPGVQEQFRISGNAYILPASQFVDNTHSLQGGTGALPDAETKRIIQDAKRLRDAFNGAGLIQGEFDWEVERVSMFESMSSHMRASWVRPVPGTPMTGYDDAKAWPETVPKRGEAKGSEVDIAEAALVNFALVVIDPFFVDHVELGVTPNQRTTYTRGENEWAEQIVVP